MGMLAKTFSATQDGVDGTVVCIESAKQEGNPAIQITGLPNDVIKESRERIRVCLSGLGFNIPSTRIVVHLSPAHAKKQGRR